MRLRLATDESGRAVHVPVMAERILELVHPCLTRPDSVFVDATVGLAGHCAAVLAENPSARLIGIDRDRQALEIAGKRLAEFGGRVHLVQARFDELSSVCEELGVSAVSAFLFDLGLSSLQIDRTQRGFAYSVDAPLDMRMSLGEGKSAAEIVNTYSQSELVRIFTRYGEEPNALRIAKAIVRQRSEQPFENSARLVEVIEQALPAAVRYKGSHPAKRVFQALRIEVNGELEALSKALPEALRLLDVGGRCCVLSYHSLEDRIVKHQFADVCRDDVPRGLPIVPPQRLAKFKAVTKGCERPTETEIQDNPRAASARLRVCERVRSKVER